MSVQITDPGGGSITVAPFFDEVLGTVIQVSGSAKLIDVDALTSTIQVRGTASSPTDVLFAYTNLAFFGFQQTPFIQAPTSNVTAALFPAEQGKFSLTTGRIDGKTWTLRWRNVSGESIGNITMTKPPEVSGASSMTQFFSTFNRSGALYWPPNGQVIRLEFRHNA